MKKHVALTALTFMLLSIFGISHAVSIPYTIGNINDFLGNSAYFNGFGQINPEKVFSGEWQYTAIASEAGNVNITESPNKIDNTFSNQNTSNWGSFKSINFDSGNIYFSDLTDGPKNIALDPFTANSQAWFKLFVLTADSKPLNYLAGNPGLVLPQGTIIVGWNDNKSFQSNDSDYDDMIIAMVKVPEPATMLLLGFGLIGIAGISRRRFR